MSSGDSWLYKVIEPELVEDLSSLNDVDGSLACKLLKEGLLFFCLSVGLELTGIGVFKRSRRMKKSSLGMLKPIIPVYK